MNVSNASHTMYNVTDTFHEDTSMYKDNSHPSLGGYYDYYYDYEHPTNETNFNYTYYPDYYGEISDFERHIDYFTYIFLSLQVCIGLTGNVISFIVWTKGKECSNIACANYFKFLAVADIFALLFCGLFLVIFKASGMLDFSHLAMCVGFNFLFLFVPQLSTWLVVCISVERVLSLTFPFSFSPTGARLRAKVAFIVLIVVLSGINSYSFLMDVTSDVTPLCYVIVEHTYFYEFMLKVSSVWVLCVVPFALIITCNTLIVVQLCLMRRFRATERQRSERLATFTKLAVASGVLQTVAIFPALLKGLFDSYESGVRFTYNQYLVLQFCSRNTVFLNNCLNFLIYCFSSKQFRSDLRNLFCTNRTRTNRTIVTATDRTRYPLDPRQTL